MQHVPMWRWGLEGVRQAIVGPAFAVGFSLVSVGGIAREAGFSSDVAAVSTLLIWAGPAQVIFFTAVIAKASWAAVALSVSVSSVRMLPMGIALLPLLRWPGVRLTTMLAAAHFLSVTVWAESLRRLPLLAPEARLPFYFGFALACIGVTTLFTLAGFALIGRLPMPLAAGLLFLPSIYFLATLAHGARRRIDWLALFFGVTLAPITTLTIGGGFDLLVLGLVGGTLATLGARWRPGAGA